MNISRLLRTAGALLVVGCGGAAAAPFCVTNDAVPPQCLYVDASSCQTEANRQGGWCVANPAEMQTPPGPGGFCVSTGAGATQCTYVDRGSCLMDAQRMHGACVEANAGLAGTPDPFRNQRPY